MRPVSRKPAWIRLLSFFLWVNTFGMIAQIMLVFGHTPAEFPAIWAKLTFQNRLVMFCSPIAALGVQRVRPWGWYAAMMFFMVSLYNNFILLRFPAPLPTTLVVIACMVLVACGAFFLSVKVIALFHNEQLHWWRPATRYRIPVPVELEYGTRSRARRTAYNISRTGLFVESAPLGAHPGDLVQFCIRFEKRLLKGLASVVRCTGPSGTHPEGLALKFHNLSFQERFWLQRTLKTATLA